MELKQPLTFENQLQHLISAHNLSICDQNEALRILKTVNYYRLTGYGIGLKRTDNKELYQEGITLEHIYSLYKFDSLFKTALVHIVEQIEIQLRNKIAYQLATHYGAEAHMDANNFISKTNKDGKDIHQTIVEAFQNECLRQKNLPFVKHHLDKYEGHFPVWVAVELFTFGNLCSLYDIMKPEDRSAIADWYNTEPKYLGSWMLALIEVRNICAHYGRIYNMPLKQCPFLYKEYRIYRTPKQNKVFPVLLVIKRMLDPSSEWSEFCQNLSTLFCEYSQYINLSFIGFPVDWETILTSKAKTATKQR